MWIGADLAAYAVDLHSGRVTESFFESPFMEFFVSRKPDVLVAVHESGMRCFNDDGSEEAVTVEQMGRSPVVISLADGRSTATTNVSASSVTRREPGGEAARSSDLADLG